MADVTCFVTGLINVEDLGSDMYAITVHGKITDTAGSVWQEVFTFQKNPVAQWRNRIIDAVKAKILNDLGETVVFIVWPDLTAENV